MHEKNELKQANPKQPKRATPKNKQRQKTRKAKNKNACMVGLRNGRTWWIREGGFWNND